MPDADQVSTELDVPDPVDSKDANCGQLSETQKEELMTTLDWFIHQGLFPTDPKRVPACLDGELTLPLIDESHSPVAGKQRTFSRRNADDPQRNR